jgi:hypothetical protein
MCVSTCRDCHDQDQTNRSFCRTNFDLPFIFFNSFVFYRVIVRELAVELNDLFARLFDSDTVVGGHLTASLLSRCHQLCTVKKAKVIPNGSAGAGDRCPSFHAFLSTNFVGFIMGFKFVATFGACARTIKPRDDTSQVVQVTTGQSGDNHSIHQAGTADTALTIVVLMVLLVLR